jgi:hypothetical protein
MTSCFVNHAAIANRSGIQALNKQKVGNVADLFFHLDIRASTSVVAGWR